MRVAAFTGNTDYISEWCSGRQVGLWAVRTSRAAPNSAQKTQAVVATGQPADPTETLRELNELHQRGVVSDAEFETLRADLRV